MSFQFVTAVWKENLSVYLKIQLKSSSSKMEIKKKSMANISSLILVYNGHAGGVIVSSSMRN